ncbi:MAG: polysaccharide biosynthesis protein [Planctomycetota bacterium]|nr:MAG: polysaccharide biosynthesis protein [Planctomycetota bacterium]
MTRSPVLFRVDADPANGYGSFYRCLVFAAALQRRRRTAWFLANIEPNHLVMGLKKGGNEWIAQNLVPGSKQDAENTIAQARAKGCLAVVIDLPQAETAYFEALDKAGILVICIDHRARAKFPKGMIVNPLAGPSRVDYSHHPKAQLLLGERYAIVRPELRRARPLRAQEPVTDFRIMVALGDHDKNRQTVGIVKTLLSSTRLAKIDVAIRNWHPDLQELEDLAVEHKDRLGIALESADVGHRIIRCHLAITSGDQWSLEFAMVGVPQLILVQDEEYWPCAKRLEEEGVASILGSAETISPNTIKGAVADLLANPQERQSMTRCGRNLVDGRGPDRLVLALEVMLQPWLKTVGESVAA